MSYESFVESLDEDDLFTTQLFEILLKVCSLHSLYALYAT